MVGKRVEGPALKLPASIGPLKVMTLPMASRPDWIAVKSLWPANQQRVALLAGNQPLPVDAQQRVARAARGEDDPVAAGQLGQLVNIGQPCSVPAKRCCRRGMTCWWATSCPACCRRSTQAAACWLMQYRMARPDKTET